MGDPHRLLRSFKVPIVLILAGFLLLGGVQSERSPDGDLRFPSDRQDLCRPSSPAAACPVTCFRPDPVCGEDGITYWCGCADAACSGARVAKLGFCEVGNGGNGLLSGQALLLVHLLWLIALAFSVVFGLF